MSLEPLVKEAREREELGLTGPEFALREDGFMSPLEFATAGGLSVGDLVTRDGSDMHLVTRLSADGVTGDFLCVIPPKAGWIGKGESEFNLCRRYDFVRKQHPGEFSVTQEPALF